MGVVLAVEEVDPEVLPEEDLRATHRLWRAYDDEFYPWRPPAPFEAYAHIARSHPRLPEVRSWVARRAGTMVGTAELEVWKVGQERPFAEISVGNCGSAASRGRPANPAPSPGQIGPFCR